MDFLATARRQMLAGQLQDARERLLNSYAGLSEKDMLQPGACGDWSVRDILAHLAAWDRSQTAMYRAMISGERHPMLDLDEEANESFNHEHHQATLDAILDEVITELMASREEMIEVLREIDNTALFAPAPGDDHADMSIAACISVSVNHDEEHAQMIEDWREQQGK
ncbi:MAG TPA: DinB family protein [Chloroflexia bacterium]|nr:DinB family protein [Chloroflexia bacterium]